MGLDLLGSDRFEVAHIAAGIDILFRIDQFCVGSGIWYTDPVICIRDRFHIQNDKETIVFFITRVDVDRLFIVIGIDPAE